jgi:hypothetical protein
MSYSCCHKKLPAFTLMEIMVGMIVSTIVIAVIFSAWHIISKQSEQFHLRSEKIRDLSLMHSFLVVDTQSADSIFCENESFDGIRMTMYCYQRHADVFNLAVTWSVHDQFLIRKAHLAADTFLLDSAHTFNLSHYAGDQP